jgi:hypothetical protein
VQTIKDIITILKYRNYLIVVTDTRDELFWVKEVLDKAVDKLNRRKK